MSRRQKSLAALVFGITMGVPALHAESLMVSNDEWMWSDSAFGRDNDQQFARNVASWLTGGSGNILILSSNFGLDNSSLPSYLSSLGYGVTVTTTVPGSFSGYQAVYVAGDSPSISDAMLLSYVNGGGNVLLEAGTGCCGGAAGEASQWNPLLTPFGLALAPIYNGIGGDINVASFQTQPPYGPALFGGVNTVFIDNGNNVLNLGTDSSVEVFNDSNGNGLYGAWRASSVPEPSSLLLLLLESGLTSVGLLFRRLAHILR